ncbi:MAG: squalene/phytoene synthase family protein [Thermoguttaceae bacterium]|jgi:phytoene synthase|nr:squalene/phytoene synthase family protein [Thermoguttaceae bacterium]
MNGSTGSIDASYAACRQISRRARSSFYSGFLLLSGAKRRAMNALYAFARVTDDIVDGPATLAERRRRLDSWRGDVEAAFNGGGTTGFRNATADSVATSGHNPVVTLPALVDAAVRFAIPREHFCDMLDGAAMDLDRNRYATFDELEVYCRRVASSVGLACVHIWGFRSPAVFEPAVNCGVALQLTNILRDVKEDLARDRLYLPQEDLQRHHYTEADVRSAVADSRFASLMADQVARAERYYREGVLVLQWLDSSGRRVCGMMIDRYRALLEAIARRPEAVLHRRIGLGASAQARLALRWLFGGRTLRHA